MTWNYISIRGKNDYNIAGVLPYLIPIGVIMVHFETYARPCVYQMTCASQMEKRARYVVKNTIKKCIFVRACRSLMKR